MMRCRLGRAVLAWCGAAGATGTLAVLLRPELEELSRLMDGRRPPSLAHLLVGTSAAALVGCAAWAWLALSVALATSLAGRRTRWAGAPRWVRRLVVAGCGLTVIALPTAVQAAPTSGQPPGVLLAPSVEGLSVPTLPETAPPRPRGDRAAPPAARSSVVVAPGDTLWSLARDLLPSGADEQQIEQRWRALWQTNRNAIGADPDLIRPGLRLDTGEEER